ncbi:MAG: class I SAM-dependent methyltransferase [Phycisphaeraceae bacterium]|nr:class I SAM-dependent methyltransferase [Phycisphaeraceae bacterium]
MTTTCYTCQAPIGKPIYESPTEQSLTSLIRMVPGRTRVYHCGRCGHLQTPALDNLGDYYDQQYTFLVESDEEDQLYCVEGDQKIFRADHQLRTLLNKIDLPQNASVLDYGCAKALTTRKLLGKRADLNAHLFDVSELYLPFWENIVDRERQATYEIPDTWAGKFDLVMSYFVLEHVVDPVKTLRSMRGLVKPGGLVYFLVPNTYSNPADLVVADHTNHFGRQSLLTCLDHAGLKAVEIDNQAHQSAWVVIATNKQPLGADIEPIESEHQQAVELASYWSAAAQTITQQEASRPEGDVPAVYGSGFYGTFIASCLNNPDAIRAFVDQNTYLQGQTHLDKPIVAPEQLEESVKTIYVGLNPRIARKIIEGLNAWRDRDLQYIYL